MVRFQRLDAIQGRLGLEPSFCWASHQDTGLYLRHDGSFLRSINLALQPTKHSHDTALGFKGFPT